MRLTLETWLFSTLSFGAFVAAAPGRSATITTANAAPTVTVKNGTYVGFNDPILNTDNFYGVAYAQPPIGDLRFRHSQGLNTTWSEERLVVDYPKQCITTGVFHPFKVVALSNTVL
jgi:triacylglycerol lipase